MKRIGLGIAAAALTVTGVASASSMFSTSGNHHSATIAASDSGITATAGVSVPGAPAVDDVLDAVELPDAAGLLDTVTGAVPSTDGIGIPGVADVTSKLPAVPSACGTALPVGLPLPTRVLAAGMTVAESIAALAQIPAGVSVPDLGLPVATPDVFGKATAEADCLAAGAGSSPIPSICGVHVPSSLPVAVPGEISSLVGALTQDLGNVTGQSIAAAGSSVGVSCTTDVVPAITGAVPAPASLVPALPAAPALPKVDVPALPSVPSVPSLPEVEVPSLPVDVPAVTDVVDTVTSIVPPLPLLSCQASGSATTPGLLGGLLGGITASISGSC